MEQLYAFIQQRRIIGETDEQIAAELLNNGWDPTIVRQALTTSTMPTHDRIPKDYHRLVIIASGVLALILLVIVITALFSSSGSDNQTVTSNLDEIAQRDTIRDSDLNRIFGEAERFASLNNGRYPEANQESWDSLVSAFASFEDPFTRETYVFTTAAPEIGQMQYANRVICNEDTLTPGSERNIAIRVFLESGEIKCVDNL